MNVVRLFILTSLLIALAGFATPSARAQSLAVSDVSAVSSFPAGVTFSVTAESDVPIVKAELLYTRAEQETLNLVTAPLEPALQIDIDLPVDFQINYVPPGIEITYRWRVTDENEKVIETERQSITWEDTRFEWQVLTSEEVSVYFYNENDAFSQSILDSAQSTIDRLQSNFSVDQVRPIRIWVYDSKSDFSGSQAPNSQEWIAGTAYPELQVILAVLPEGNEREVGRVVPHEISHQVLFQASRNPFNAPPTWFDEGLAVSAQDNGNENFQAMVEAAAEDGRLFSVRSLTSEFPYDPADASLAYAESFSVLQFMIERWGNEGVAAVIAAYAGGLSHDDALMQGIGVDVDGLDQLWKESLNYGGDQGVAGATDEPSIQWYDRILGNAAEFIFGLVILASVITMIWRFRHREKYEEFDEMSALA